MAALGSQPIECPWIFGRPMEIESKAYLSSIRIDNTSCWQPAAGEERHACQMISGSQNRSICSNLLYWFQLIVRNVESIASVGLPLFRWLL
jgi:hypothetical protein